MSRRQLEDSSGTGALPDVRSRHPGRAAPGKNLAGLVLGGIAMLAAASWYKLARSQPALTQRTYRRLVGPRLIGQRRDGADRSTGSPM